MRQIESPPEAAGETTVRARGPVYRDDSVAIQQQLDGERIRHRQEAAPLRAALAPVYAARAGRAAAGIVLLAGTLLLLASAAYQYEASAETGWLTAILLATWPAAALARSLARAWARRRFGRRLHAPLATTDDAHGDLARLRRLDLRQHAARLLAPLERYSVAPALAGIMLLLPLTLHFLIALLQDQPASASGLWYAFTGFDAWILLSMLIVGHCHVLLAVLAWLHGKRLANRPDYVLIVEPSRAGWRAYGLTVLSSLLPGAFLILLPVVLVAVTGLFVPLLFARAHATVTRERDLVARALRPAR